MTSDRKPNAADIVARLARKEKDAGQGLVLAPVIAGAGVRVRLEGIVYELELDDRSFSGWALLRIVAPGKAKVEGRPSPKEVSSYLSLFPKLRLILLESHQGAWWAIPAQEKDARFQINTAVPVEMVERGAAFDTVYARFDGSRFWCESADKRRDPSIARKLRKSLEDDVDPQELHILSSVPQEHKAYKILWLLKHPEKQGRPSARERSDEDRIREALAHAGAELDAFWQANDGHYNVRFEVDGQLQTVRISSDLNVTSAGICLSGLDHNFDLTSLVGVFREFHRREDWD